MEVEFLACPGSLLGKNACPIRFRPMHMIDTANSHGVPPFSTLNGCLSSADLYTKTTWLSSIRGRGLLLEPGRVRGIFVRRITVHTKPQPGPSWLCSRVNLIYSAQTVNR
jgi:hypothetical protein